ncbi:MAG: fructose-1,6-bisphosphatase [Anaerovoracaceae bacterium]|jgi:fructose-1,6-bisphosphatase-3
MPDIKFLELLSKDYPNIQAASAEIINLNAILALPKGTEYFLSDLHGEHEAFIHMLKSASGTIKSKIDEHYSGILSEQDRDDLAALIYNADAEIKRRKKSEADFDKWCATVIYRMIKICQSVSTKYTRSKIRRRMPKYLDYAMDELLHADDEANRAHYYDAIISSIIQCGIAETFIKELADLISTLAVDQLHIIGDVFDRGAHPDDILDFLMDYHDVDFQWGNHDVLWMGAACGNWPCIANIVRNNVGYNNFDMMEIGYGINLRPLATFAEETYADDDCEAFMPHLLDMNKYDQVKKELAAKMHKAIAVIQFKVEGQAIMNHPEYEMDKRLILDKIDFDRGTVMIEGREYALKDTNLPTIDRNDPYKLTKDELFVMESLEASIMNSEKLQKHIRYLYSHGAMYKTINGNLLYHGCLPMNEDGSFMGMDIAGRHYEGKAMMDVLDEELRNVYFSPSKCRLSGNRGDIMWYLWEGAKSPLFGKDKMTTFERLFIADKSSHKENTNAYYTEINKRSTCEMILREFGLDPSRGKILNGHVPVKLKDGESPIKGEGLLYMIDGGIAKAYQKKTGIAGYTFIFNSRFMALAEHKPYSPLQPDGTQEFHSPEMKIVQNLSERMLIVDTDKGKEINDSIDDLTALVQAYKEGIIKEKY